MRKTPLEVVGETKSAIAFRVRGTATGEGRAAVVYLSPTLTRNDAASVLRTVAEQLNTDCNWPTPPVQGDDQ
jgi:hypothetical protein